ncbi:MAG: FkbM family methyltransferase [Gemmatimonadota bacterium]|nr:MAG: FkbM family methyltransferase [Gemmatimonadota bacterium]
MANIKDTPLYQKLRYRARAMKYARRVDPDEIRFLRRLLKPGDLAIDVGAHKGGYVYWMQKAVAPSGKVLVFEPQKELAEYLNYIKGIFRFAQVEVVETALSNTSGTRSLFSPSSRVSTGATLVENLFPENDAVDQVEVITLDEYFSYRTDLHPPRFIKIDVETHELEVLEGGREVLETARPVVLLEADQHVYGERPIFKIFEFLALLRFDGFFFFNKKLRPLEEFDLSMHQPPELKENPNHPGFANNFIFLDGAREAQILRRYGRSSN